PFMVAIWVAFDVAILSGPLHDYFSAGYRFRSFTLEERLLTQPRVVWFYLSQFALPLPGRFSIEHDFVLSSGLLSPPSTLVAIGGLAVWLVVGLGLLARLRTRLIGFLMLWPLATLAIESSFVPLEMVFEHRMYIPTIGLLGLVGVAVSRVHWQHRWLPGVAILAGVVVVLLMVSTGERNQVWRSSLSLQEDALRNAPNSSRVWRNYGFYAYQAGEIDKARSAAERSLALHGMNAHAHELMGIILLDKGDLERAQWHLDMALRAEPENESFLNHRGEIALQQGQYAEAEKMFRAAVARAGWNPVYYWNLALAYEGTGACSSAKEAWRTYLSLEPSASDRQLVEEHLDSEYASPSGTCYRQ
ncbi:tetratricopeptide repeat protein, partial [Sedimenticola sp.]|uniref:tetratricopeptide repeat protein n=1 Tax=Sedimenticola sp. TaxID=1940285 RepID=UPI003D133896